MKTMNVVPLISGPTMANKASREAIGIGPEQMVEIHHNGNLITRIVHQVPRAMVGFPGKDVIFLTIDDLRLLNVSVPDGNQSRATVEVAPSDCCLEVPTPRGDLN